VVSDTEPSYDGGRLYPSEFADLFWQNSLATRPVPTNPPAAANITREGLPGFPNAVISK